MVWQYSNSDPLPKGRRLQGCEKNRDFLPISRIILEMIQDRAILTIADQQKVVYGLSNGTVLGSLTLNIPQTARFGHSCYKMWIGNCTQAFKWYYFQWLEWHSEIFSDTKHRAVSLRQLSFLYIFRSKHPFLCCVWDFDNGNSLELKFYFIYLLTYYPWFIVAGHRTASN